MTGDAADESLKAGIPPPRDIRVASNQTTTRRVINEAIEEGRQTAARLIGFVCECGALGCGVVLELSIDEYEHVRADGRQFVVAKGHATPGDEIVGSVDQRFVIVTKRGDDAASALAADPRAEGPAVDLLWAGGISVPAMSMSAPATASNVRSLRRWVLAFAAEHGADDDLRGRIAVAVGEALANVVAHAYTHADEGTISVAVDFGNDDLEVVVSDDGHGFRSGEASGLGTGLSIIARTSDRFAIRQRLPSGVEVWMRFAVAEA
jgi:anti-sigma regulatory factor (Ser/Thr protein kinase)